MSALWKRLSGTETDGVQVANASEQAKVDRLVQMGFDSSPALFALRQADGNVDAAVSVLLSGAESSAPTSATSHAQSAREIRAAAAEARQARNPLSQIRSAMNRGRTGSQLQQQATQNNSQRQPQESSRQDASTRSFESRLEIVCGALAGYPRAVDQLLYMIKTIISNPGVRRYREVKTSNRRFVATVGTAGTTGHDLLKLIGFVQTGDWLVLRGAEDPARLWLAQSALENVQNSSVYELAREREAFNDAITESIACASAEEAERRQEFVSSVPVEPEEGVAGTTRIRVFCGDHVVERRFHSDDVVNGIIMWLGAERSSLIPGKLASGSWELVNSTLYPPHVMELEDLYDTTLQSAGLWPGAELKVQPAGTLERERREKEHAAE